MPQGRQPPHPPHRKLAARPPASAVKRPGTPPRVKQRPAAAERPAAPRPMHGAIQARPHPSRPARRAVERSQKPKIRVGKRKAGAEHHGPAAGYPLVQDAAALTADQTRNIITCLTACHQEHAPELAVMAMLCLGYGENSWHTYGCNSGGYCGVFQLGAGWQKMHRYTDVGYWAVYALLHGFYGYGGLIHCAEKYPHQSPGYITNLCQGAYANLNTGAAYYDQYVTDARWALKTYGPRAGEHLTSSPGKGGTAGGGTIPGGGHIANNVQAIFRSTDWAGNAINCFKLMEGGANEAAHMSGLTRERVGKLTVIGWKKR